ncbi:hypothetical protein, partial [Pseudomonas poae]|uniref:hypothetical protein n=1 Tax=Pseudomonas poae TaxID=200451 RepID=UPI0034D736AA
GGWVGDSRKNGGLLPRAASIGLETDAGWFFGGVVYISVIWVTATGSECPHAGVVDGAAEIKIKSQSKAKQSKAKQSKAKQSKAKQ